MEASLEWYEETRSNPQLYAVDYVALFVETIGRVIEEVRTQTISGSSVMQY